MEPSQNIVVQGGVYRQRLHNKTQPSFRQNYISSRDQNNHFKHFSAHLDDLWQFSTEQTVLFYATLAVYLVMCDSPKLSSEKGCVLWLKRIPV